MTDLFNQDNPYNKLTTKLFDLCVLNFLFFITSLPFFTIGAGLGALFVCFTAVRENRGSSIARIYLIEFKKNFRRSAALFIPMGVVFVLLLFDLLFWANSASSMKAVGFTASVVMLILWGCIMVWLFPLSAKFENTKRNTYKNAFKFALSFAPVTLVFAVAGLGYMWLIFSKNFLWPFIPVFGFVLLLYPESLYISYVFKKYTKEHKEMYGDETDKGDFYIYP